MDWENDILKKSFIIDTNDINNKKSTEQILRMSVSSEFEAIALYQSLLENIDDKDIKKVFNEIIIDEKRHVSQFMQLLLNIDKEQDKQMDKGIQENKEILS